MKRPNMTTAAAIVFALGVAGAGFASAHSYQGDSTTLVATPDRAAVEHAIESGDYAAFVDAVGADSKMLEGITAENFSSLQKLHDLREAGDIAGAQTLAEELGLPQMAGPGGMHGKGMMRGENMMNEDIKAAIESRDYSAYTKAAEAVDANHVMTENQFTEMIAKHAEMEAKHAAVDAAIDARDYAAFVTAVGDDDRILEDINESNFDKYAELHDLREAGDMDAAKALADELGLKGPEGFGGPHMEKGNFRGGPWDMNEADGDTSTVQS